MFERVSVHCEVRAGADRITEHRAHNKHRGLRLVKLTRRLCRIKKQAMLGPWCIAWIIWLTLCIPSRSHLTLILPRSRTGTVWFYTSTSNKRAARPKLYTKSLTRDLKLMYSSFTLVRISINLNSSQLNMFREIILPIFRSTRLCVTACGVMHPPRCCRHVM